VLSVVTRILEGSSIRQQQVARDFAARFGPLSALRAEVRTHERFASLYAELVDWHIRLDQAGETGLLDSVNGIMAELRHDFGTWITRNYPRWAKGPGPGRPELSTDIVKNHVAPLLGTEPVVFVILDCMRLDQWRVIAPLLSPMFEIQEKLYYSILPTATPYARNAIFGGLFPDEIARLRPGWWDASDDEGSLNAFEDELLRDQLERITGREVGVHYEKVFTDRDETQVRGRLLSALRARTPVVALVFNFVDLMTHGRSESPILMEVAKDAAALRQLTRSWFERSTAFSLLKEAAARRHRVVLTTDHGSIHCRRPATIYARRDASTSLRYKFGGNLRARDPRSAYAPKSVATLRLPRGSEATNCLVALDDYFFVYPTKLREYQRRYRNSFLHGGISPEEMIVPVSVLRPRPR
jgi:hypothetical protein